jgi:DNA adenine methylase
MARAAPTRSGIPLAIPYQGSKRRLAAAILSFIPEEAPRLFEPFCGSAAVAIAAAARSAGLSIRLNDADRALARLWEEVLARPEELALAYGRLWAAQVGRERSFYDEVRVAFNAGGEPDLFLFLLSRCVKAAVRYNARGEFNQSPDNRRRGTHPSRMARNLVATAAVLGGRTEVSALDFRAALRSARPADVIYLDPPYQGVSTARDRRYRHGLALSEFVDSLIELDARDLSFIVSYDGRTGEKVHGRRLPDRLALTRYEVDAGRSAQSTLAGRREQTVESLYISAALRERLARRRAR